MLNGKKLERRSASLEIRAQDGAAMPKIVGYTAVFNEVSAAPIYGEFYEMFMPGCFSKALASSELDVEVLIRHYTRALPIARYRAGAQNNSLSMREDDKGLLVEINPANTSDARDAIECMRHGIMDGMSIGFYAMRDEWNGLYEGLPLRKIYEAWFDDVSLVPNPAYSGAGASLRSKENEMTPDEYKKLAQAKTKNFPSIELLSLELELEKISLE